MAYQEDLNSWTDLDEGEGEEEKEEGESDLEPETPDTEEPTDEIE